MAGFVTVLLCSNLIGPGKTCILFGLTFAPGTSSSDLLHLRRRADEVYGYARTRKVIWAGFISMIFATIMGLFVIHMPADPKEPSTHDPARPRDRLRQYGADRRRFDRRVLVRRLHEQLRHGEDEGLDRGAPSLDPHDRLDGGRQLVDSASSTRSRSSGPGSPDDAEGHRLQLGFKVSVEIVFTPVTYAIVGWLKRQENEDWFDRHTDFTPFSLKD